jgi:hypothetical protein
VLSSTIVGEEGVGKHLIIWLMDVVLKAIELPAGVSCLDITLADMEREMLGF